MTTIQFPSDSAELKSLAASGDSKAFAVRLLALAHMLSRGLGSLDERHQSLAVALRAGTTEGGLLAAAFEIRNLLAEFPQGREALAEFGFQPVFQQIEGE